MADKQYPTQSGPGTSVPKAAPSDQPSAPSPAPAANNPSGSSQGHDRGKDGKS